jgi:hypothetical protein
MSTGNPPQGTRRREAGVGDTELLEGKAMGASKPATVSTKLQRIAKLAREAPTMALMWTFRTSSGPWSTAI